MNLTALRETLGHRGPFASVHLDASHDTEDAAKVTELRWRAIRDQLAAQDAPDPTLGALDEALDQPPPAGRAGRLLVAAGNEVLVDEYLPAPPAQPMARVSPLPYLLPLADWNQRGVPHVVVTVDRTGADLRAVDGDGTTRDEDVSGRDHPVHKVRSGGMSHLNMQQHTDETVRRNLADVAQEAVRLVRDVDARLLVLAGDAGPRAQLRDELPESCQRIAVEIEHSRPPGTGEDVIEDELAELLTERRRAERDEVLERFRTATGHGLAVQGLAATTAALRDANVEVLLIDARAAADATVYTGTEPNMVAVDRDELHRVGVSERLHVPADEALPAAALAVGADILATSGDEPPLELKNGVGALLRHT